MVDVAREQVERGVLNAVSDVVTGTSWAPPEDAVLSEVVVVMGWFHADGTYGSSHVNTGAPWSARGLLAQTLQRIEATYDDEISGAGEVDE